MENEFRWQHILAYIHHNPIHHKFRKTYEDWTFSSYLAFLSNAPTAIAREQVLSCFDKDPEKAKSLFIKYHQDFKMDKEMNEFYLDEL